ncbi:MAG: polysaccharide biosynthesis C-terminal domain-containing protein [Lachnospiraceae bacterium]|nr:polysaccharide biosynthesis C-terminal domain-containing protein [Lachnospiraceae bacterium]
MNKFKLFMENFIIYGLGGIINKLIPLVMIPVITRLMPDTTYYGISDMANIMVSFGTAIAVLGMYDAMYRLFFEKDESEYRIKVCSTTLAFVGCTSILISFLLIVFKKRLSYFFLGSSKVSFIIYLIAVAVFFEGVNTIIASPTRMQNKRKIYLITNTVGPAISYTMSILLLIKGHYLIAMPLGLLISSLFIHITYIIINKSWFSYKFIDLKMLRVMLPIGIPMAVNTLTYWVYNSCDRLMITNLINVGESGVYANGAKLGHASQLVYTAFAAGWQYFAFSTMKEEDQVKSNSLVFEYLGAVSFAVSMFVCTFSKSIFKVLFTSEYQRGYIIAPYLFLAPLLLMLFQVISNQFLVIKKTWPNMLILILGAVVNIGLNYILIPRIGIEGAAVATLSGYIVALIIAAAVLSRMKLFKVSVRFPAASVVMLLVMLLWRLLLSDNMPAMLVLSVAGVIIIMLLYIKDLRFLVNRIKVRKEENNE